MKTHELAEAMKFIANMLMKGPDIEVGDVAFIDRFDSNFTSYTSSSRRKSSREDLPVALSALLSLSRFSKPEWIALLNDLGIQVDISTRDSSRDILGKVLRHLEKSAEARTILSERVTNREAKASPELARALSSLLGRS